MVNSNLLSQREVPSRIYSFLFMIINLFIGIIEVFIPNALKFRRFKNVSNQIVLITGGGSGIGQLMALKFLKLGSKVVIWDVNQKGMEKTKSMALDENKNFENKLWCYQMDLSDPKSIKETAEKLRKDVGKVDILINNAGVVSGCGILDLPDSKIELTFRVNALAHFYTIKEFLPDMIQKKNGHIVTVASLAGDIGVSYLSDYCATKFANLGMHESLYMELLQSNLADKIHTTLVKPYLIATGMFAGTKADLFDYLEPDFVASKIVEGVLTNQLQVVLPWYFTYLVMITRSLPLRCFQNMADFFGATDSMTQFHGRSNQQSAEQKKVE